jgi:excisionase family DNA binding protein
MQQASRLLTTGQVARLCDSSPSAVLKWIRAGKLPTYSTPGGQYRVSTEELSRFLRRYRMRVPPELGSAARHRVLILTDDLLARESLGRMLEASGLDCQVDSEEDGLLGCMRIPELKPDLVIFDLVMRKPDGADLCRAVRAHRPDARTKILLLAAEPKSLQAKRLLLAGADGWLAKPVKFEALLRKVGELLGVRTTNVVPAA